MLRLATRGSPLALWQARHVASLLRSAFPGLETELVTEVTAGDRRPALPVWEMGGQGVFVREVQAAVLAGRVEAAVHSAKDLPAAADAELCLAAFPPRADARDVLVGSALAGLPEGATVATGSPRRRAQLAALRPDLRFANLRGNIATRLDRVPPGGAIVVALAALDRLGLRPEVMEVLDTDVMLPQVAQGAIAVECRRDDPSTMSFLQAVDDPPTRCRVEAERAFLSIVGGACDLPVAGYATLRAPDRLRLDGLVATPDGTTVVRHQAEGHPEHPVELGAEVARLVLEGGGRDLLGRHGL